MTVDQQGVGTVDRVLVPRHTHRRRHLHRLLDRSTGIGRTFGLLQATNGFPTPDPQWPILTSANLVVDPVNGNDIVISSDTGSIFATTDTARPGSTSAPGGLRQPRQCNVSLALAYGAPDPNAPEGVGNLGNFIYVGTSTGQIYVTQDGGGPQARVR